MPARLDVFLASALCMVLVSFFIQTPILESREPPPQPSHSPQLSTEPEIQVEIHSANERDTRIVLTNLSEQSLTAFFLHISYASENRAASKMLWDAFQQNKSPVAKNATVELPLGHAPGVPFLGKIKVAAAVWADGATFGSPDELRHIFANRAFRARALDRIISLLQTGLQQQWTRDKYLAALEQEPKFVASQALGLSSTLKANENLDSDPRTRQKLIEEMLQRFAEERDALRRSKPDFTAPYIPN